MQNSYSKSSRQVLEIAQEQAKEFHHRLVGTEHVLLALVIEADGKAGKILRTMNVTPTGVRKKSSATRATAQRPRPATWNFLPA